MADFVLRGATLLDGTGAPPMDDATVVVQGERILEVGQGPAAHPTSAEVHELHGGYLVPGLCDAHAHVEDAPELQALVEFGVTTIRNPALRGTRRPATLPDATPRPMVHSAGRPIDGPQSALPFAMRATTPAEVRDEVRRQAEGGTALVKLYIGLAPEQVVAGIDEAHALGLQVIGDLVSTSWTEAARAGIDFLCHAVPRHPSLLPEDSRSTYLEDLRRGAHPVCRWLELLDPDGPEVREMARVVSEAGVAVDPTLVSLEAMLFAGDPRYHATVDPDGAEVAPDLTSGALTRLRRLAGAAWEKALLFVGRLHREGVTLLAGSDCPRPWVRPGASLHRELGLLADAVLLLSDDPLADLANSTSIRWVMQGGEIVKVVR